MTVPLLLEIIAGAIIFSSCISSEISPNYEAVQVKNLHHAYIHELGAGPFPVEFYTNREMTSFRVYHNGLRLPHTKARKNNTQFKFPMDPSNSSNVGLYEIIFNEGLANEFRQNTSLYLKLGQYEINIVGVRERNNELSVACEIIGLLGNPTVLVRNDKETIIGSSSTADQITNTITAAHMKYQIGIKNEHKPQNLYCEINARVVDSNKKFKSKSISLDISPPPCVQCGESQGWSIILAAILSAELCFIFMTIVCIFSIYLKKQIRLFSSTKSNNQIQDVEMEQSHFLHPLIRPDKNHQPCEQNDNNQLEEAHNTDATVPVSSISIEMEESTKNFSNAKHELKMENNCAPVLTRENKTKNATFQCDTRESEKTISTNNGTAKEINSNKVKLAESADTTNDVNGDASKKPSDSRVIFNQNKQNDLPLPTFSNDIATNGNHTNESTPLTTDVDSDSTNIQTDDHASQFDTHISHTSEENTINNGNLVNLNVSVTQRCTSITNGHIHKKRQNGTVAVKKYTTRQVSCP